MDTHIRLAHTYKINDRYEEAINEAEYIINRVPLNSEINTDMHYILGSIYLYKKKEFEPATYHFNKVLAKRPKMVDPYISFAQYYLKINEKEKALKMIDKALAISPKNIHVHNMLLNLYQEENDWDNLIITYKNILEYYPTKYDMRVTLAELFLKLKRYEEAKAETLKIFKIDPKDLRMHYILGEVDFQQGKYQDALQHFIYLVNANYNINHILSRLGSLYKNLGHYKEAIECYERLVFTRPDIFEAQYYLTLLTLKTRNYRKAEKAALALKERLYNYQEADFYVGKAQFFHGKIQDAISSLKKYHQHDYEAPAKTTRYAFYKIAYPSMLSYEEFSQENRAHNQVESRYIMGLAYLMTDKNEEAIKELEKLVFEEPNLPFGFILAAIAHHRLGNYEEALKHCNITEVLVGVDKSLVNFVKANIYASQWELDKAQLLLKRADGAVYSYNFSNVDITNYTSITDPNSLADLSMAIMMMRNNWKEKSLELCKRVLKTNPKNSLANYIDDNMYILFNEYYAHQSQITDHTDRITIPEVYK